MREERDSVVNSINVKKIQQKYFDDEMIWRDKSQFYENDKPELGVLMNIKDE